MDIWVSCARGPVMAPTGAYCAVSEREIFLPLSFGNLDPSHLLYDVRRKSQYGQFQVSMLGLNRNAWCLENTCL